MKDRGRRTESVVLCLWSSVKEIGESEWESNPPRLATRPTTGVEDQEAHRDLTTPINKDNRRQEGMQEGLSEWIKVALDSGLVPAIHKYAAGKSHLPLSCTTWQGSLVPQHTWRSMQAFFHLPH